MSGRARPAGILVVDDAVPRIALGAGHPRGLAVLRELARLAPRVALLPMQPGLGEDLAGDALPQNVEVLSGSPDEALLRALSGEPRAYDVLWVGRPNNLAFVERFSRLVPHAFDGVRVIYDAEAVFALRDARRRALDGTPMSEVRERRALREEFHPAAMAHAIATVSEAERRVIAEHVARPVVVLSLPATVVAAPRTPGERSGALFVGSLSPADSPNGDGLRWLLREAWPRLAGGAERLTVIGRGGEAGGWAGPLAGPGVRLLGSVADLAPHYAGARCFVAPLRYGAGIPLKVVDAVRHGVPVIATPLVAELLGWRDGTELLVAADAPAFAAAVQRLTQDDGLWSGLVEGAQAALARDFSPERFAAAARSLVLGEPKA
jgi:glycosyltransferase involved in cell wall biosynthesis